jgi:hypothetical protein
MTATVRIWRVRLLWTFWAQAGYDIDTASNSFDCYFLYELQSAHDSMDAEDMMDNLRSFARDEKLVMPEVLA